MKTWKKNRQVLTLRLILNQWNPEKLASRMARSEDGAASVKTYFATPTICEMSSMGDDMATKSREPLRSTPAAFSAGIVIVSRKNACWRLLALRAYRNWDFPKGKVEAGETPLSAAIRETAEEAGITDLAFRWGEGFCETAPYGARKVARYYLAETTQQAIILNRSPHGSRPEHHEWRWVSFDEAGSLLPPRLQPVLGWATKILEA